MTEITKDTELTAELLKELKTQYKKLYKTTLSDDQEFIWHKINRKEYKEIMKKYDDVEDREERLWLREEEACRIAIVYPCKEIVEEILSDSAGIATIISDEIYEKSGFRVVEQTEEI